jgi:hypothetical protein
MNHGSPSDRHSIWGIHALWEQLQGDLPDLSIEVVDRLDSTNGALMDRLRQLTQAAQGRPLRASDLAPRCWWPCSRPTAAAAWAAAGNRCPAPRSPSR